MYGNNKRDIETCLVYNVYMHQEHAYANISKHAKKNVTLKCCVLMLQQIYRHSCNL